MQTLPGAAAPAAYPALALPSATSASGAAATAAVGDIVRHVCLPWLIEHRASAQAIGHLGAELVDNPLTPTARAGLYPAQVYRLRAAPRILFWTEEAGRTSFLHCTVRSWDGGFDAELLDAFVAAGGAASDAPRFAALRGASFERRFARDNGALLLHAAQSNVARDGAGLALYLTSEAARPHRH